MFSLLKSVPIRQWLFYEVPSLAGAIVIAEICYKFHSFTLEVICFLATWCVLSVGLHAGTRLFKPSDSKAIPAA